MNLSEKNIGFAITGSFCTFSKIVNELRTFAESKANIIPIMSETAYSTNTRFGNSEFFRNQIEDITGNKIISTIKDAEPIGPKKLLDLLIVAPCTGNTLAKLANGITDTSVTLAVKAHLRNSRPVLIGISTNDGLATAAKNIGMLINQKNIYFIPYSQDDAIGKPNSLVAHFDKITNAAISAFKGEQLQPILLSKNN